MRLLRGFVTGLTALLNQRGPPLVEEGALALSRNPVTDLRLLRGFVTGLTALLNQRTRWSRKAR